MSRIPENENQDLEPSPEPNRHDGSYQPSAFSYQPQNENQEAAPNLEAGALGSDTEKVATPLTTTDNENTVGDGEWPHTTDGEAPAPLASDDQNAVESREHSYITSEETPASLFSQEQAVAGEPPPPMEPAKSKEPFWPRYRIAIALLAVLICAAFFRFYGRDFDQNTHQHPDERFITGETQSLTWPSDTSQLFDVRHSPMNLRRIDGQFPTGRPYSYGSLPVYLNKAAGWLADTVLPLQHPNNDPKYYEEYDGVTTMGRMLAAFFDLITILLVFLIGRRLYSRMTGLIAAALVAFSVTHIQIAHFYASDIFLVTFMMAALYFSIVLMQRPSWGAAIGAGLCLGMAVATKVSVIPFALIVVAAVVLRAAYRKRTRILGAELSDPIGMRPASTREREMSLGRHLLGGLGFVVLASVFALIAFMIAEPYVLWSFDWSLLWSPSANASGGYCKGTFGAWLESSPYGRALCEQAGIQSGQADVPYTRQYIGTIPVIYHLQQLTMWGLGIIPGLVAIVGFGAALWRVIRGKPAEILLMAGALPYLATIVVVETKWMRYTLPLVPIFCILGASLLMRGAAYMRTRTEKHAWLRNGRQPIVRLQRNLFPILTVLVVGWAFLWAVSFMNIYSQNHSRIQGSDFIYDNVPTTLTVNGVERKTRLSNESWDDSLPLGRPPDPATGKPLRDMGMYGPAISFGIYDDHPPADQELEYLKGLVKDTDYVVIASNRLYGSIRHEPWRYQVQMQFYTLLFQGKLGFQHLCSNGAAECGHTTQVMPSLFGINFDDQSADESFTVYDHPAVDVFKKTNELTDDQYKILFSAALNRPAELFSTERHLDPKSISSRTFDDKSLAYDQPLSTLADLHDYSWNPLAQSDTQWIAIILWLLLTYVLGLITLPIIFTICRNLPDKGYPLAKLVGLMLLAWGIWSVSSAKLLPFTIWTTIFILLLMTGVSVLCWQMGARDQIREFVATRRSLVVYYEALFLLAFFAFLFIRMLNPDLWHPSLGGEKTMEFGFLNATLRSAWMPPADPFFAGGYINYYYYGQFVMAVMIKLIGVDPAIGINLAIPLLYAFTFTAGASIVYNIVAWAQKSRGGTHNVSRVAMAFGLLASVLMLVIGNIHGLYQIIVQVNPELGTNLISWINSSHFAGLARVEQSVSSPSRGGFDFWGPSRIIHQTINEFPFWSFLFADFHPHLIDMPFTMGATGLAMNLAFAGPFRRRKTRTFDTQKLSKTGPFISHVQDSLSWLWGQGWSGALLFGVLAVMLGTLFATNTWDWPSFAGVCGGGALVAMMLAFTRKSEVENQESAVGSRAIIALLSDPQFPISDNTEAVIERPKFLQRLTLYGASIVSVGLLVGVSLLAALPFLLSFKNVLGLGIQPLVDGGKLPNVSDIMHRTTLAEFLFFWSIFVFIMLSYTIVRLWSFPWSAAVGDLVGLFSRGGSRAPRPVTSGPVFSPDAALTLQSVGAAHGVPVGAHGRAPLQPPLLAMAGAGAGAPSLPSPPVSQMAFSSEVREDLEPATESGSRMGEDGGLATSDHTMEGNGLEIEGNGHLAGESSEATNDLAATPETHSDYDSHVPWVISGLESGPLTSDMLEQTTTSESGYEPAGYLDTAPGAQTQTAERAAVRTRVIERPGVIPLWGGLGLLAVTAALVGLQIATGQLLLALLVALIGGIIATTLATSRSAPALFTGLLLVAALAVAMGVELVYLSDHLAGGEMFRMNTVFKFYIQVWLLFGAGSAAAIYYILYGVRDGVRASKSEKVVTAVVEPQTLSVSPPALQVEEPSQVVHSMAEEAPVGEPIASEYVPAVYETEAEATETASANTPTEPTYTGRSYDEAAAMMTTGSLNNWLVWAPEDSQQAQPDGHEQEQEPEQQEPDVAAVETMPVQPAPLPVVAVSDGGEGRNSAGWNSMPLVLTALIALPVNAILGFILFSGSFTSANSNVLPNAGGVIGAMLATVGVSVVFAAIVAVAVGFSRGVRWNIGHSIWLTLLAILMASALIFTKYGTENRVAQRFDNPPPIGTLDGLAFMKTAQYGVQGGENSSGGASIQMKYDREAIEWMKNNISSLHVIAEGPYEYYRDGGMRAASYTGLPMIVGGLHQGEQRYDWLVGDRDGQARQLFSTTDPQVALTIMSKYDIDYIYLGQLEQLRAGDGLQKFEQLVKAGVLKVVFKSKVPEGIKGTTVYQVVKAPKEIVGSPVQGKGVPGLSFTPVPTSTPTPPPTPPVDNPELQALVQAVANAPGDIDAHQKLVDWYRDHSFWQAAAGELEGMVKLRPQDIAVRQQLGDAYQQLGQVDKALKAWEDARDVEPDNAAAHNKLGIAYVDRHRYDDALKEFQTAFQKDPNFNEAALHMGEVYLAKGDKENAKKSFQDAVSHAQDKDNPWAKDAQKRLNDMK